MEIRIKKRVKSLAKKILHSRGYSVQWSDPARVSGVSLIDDLRRLMPHANPVCFDVGANRGQTIALLQATLDSPVIHAFEPSGDTFHILEDGIVHNERIHLYKCALGSKKSIRALRLYGSDDLNSFHSLTSNDANRFSCVPLLGEEDVHVLALSEFALERGIEKIDLLKSDTQGFDLDVLEGAGPHFSRRLIKHVLIELNFIQLYENQASADKIHLHLADYGFQLVDLYEKVRNGPFLDWATALYKLRE